MKTVTAKELKNKTGEVIRAIKNGEEIIISYRGKPLGKFVPLKEAPILKEVSGVIKKAPADMKQVKEERLKKKHEGIY
jgi:prevent-host-death family protein